MKWTGYFLMLTVLLNSACKTAQQLYDKGNYEKAAYVAADNLRKNPNDAQTRTVLENSYNKAVAQFDSIIKSNSSGKGKALDAQFDAYTKLQQLSQTVKDLDPNNNLQIKDYSADITRVANEAAAYRYEKGMKLLQQGGKANAQKALDNFQLVEKYIPDYKDVAQKIEQAESLASTNIVISTFDQRFGSYSLDGSMMQQNILWQLNNIGSDKMNHFYTAMDAQNQQIRVDQFMNLTFYGFYFSPVNSSSYNYTVSKDIPASDNNASGDDKSKTTTITSTTVTATVYVTRQIINSRVTLDCRITDATNRILYTNQFPADYTWSTNKATYTGDQRALGPNDWALINSSGTNQPDRQFIYQQLMQQVINQFMNAMTPMYQ